MKGEQQAKPWARGQTIAEPLALDSPIYSAKEDAYMPTAVTEFIKRMAY